MRKISIILVFAMILNCGVLAYADVDNLSSSVAGIKQFVDPSLPKDIKLLTLNEIKEIGVNSYPGPDDSIRINGPFYRTYINKTDSVIISALVSILSGSLTNALLKFITNTKIKTAIAALVGAEFGYDLTIPTTYVGTWTSASYSDTYEMYIYYATLVHYENSDYTDPISVQYYEVGRSATLEY